MPTDECLRGKIAACDEGDMREPGSGDHNVAARPVKIPSCRRTPKSFIPVKYEQGRKKLVTSQEQ